MVADLRQILIVGGGQAGGRAALAARAANAEAKITILAAESHYPYERPPLSKALLLDGAAKLALVLGPEAAESHRITVRLAETVSAIDRPAKRVYCESGAIYPYDRLVLATGARVRAIAIPGVDAGCIRYLRTLEDSAALRAALRPGISVAVIGGGFIGLEVAASARALGCKVSVVEAAPLLLSRVGSAKLSAYAARHHRSQGIAIELGQTATSADGASLTLSSGRKIGASVIVAGVGIAPCTALAEAAGLAVDNGVVTDCDGRTSDPDIYAAGDLTNQHNPSLQARMRLESWENANIQGAAAGRSAAGERTEAAAMPWFWSDQGDLNIQIVGAGGADAEEVVRGGGDGETIFQLRGPRLVGAITLNRARDMPLIRRVVGRADFVADRAALADQAIPLRQLLRTS